jgi:transposase
VVAPAGTAHLGRLAAVVEGEEGGLPEPVVVLARVLLAQIAALSAQVDTLEKQLRQRAANDETARRLMTIPGVGAIAATALTTFAPPPETLAKGREFAAWVGLTPRRHSTGGKEQLGRSSKMGQRDIRRLLVIGAAATIRWAARRGAPEGSWLARMLAKKPRMLVAVTLANRMARSAWPMEHSFAPAPGDFR